MSFEEYDAFCGSIIHNMKYIIPRHPYLSIDISNLPQLDADISKLSDNMIFDSDTLCSEDLLFTRGLTYECDTKVWLYFVMTYMDDKTKRGLGVMEFIDFINTLQYKPDTEKLCQVLTNTGILSHYIINEYVIYANKKMTLVSHFNRLLELADTLFFQLLMFKNRSESMHLLHIFELLPNPKEALNNYGPPNAMLLHSYLTDDVYYSFIKNIDYVSFSLCNCKLCRCKLFNIYNRRPMKTSTISDFNIEEPTFLFSDDLHLTKDETSVIIKKLREDMGMKLILKCMENRKLPILNDKLIGKTHLERNILKIYLNLIFVMFLARLVRKKIYTNLRILSSILYANTEHICKILYSLSTNQKTINRFMIIKHNFKYNDIMQLPRACYSFLEAMKTFNSIYKKENYRLYVLLEYILSKKINHYVELPIEFKAANDIRNDIIDGFVGRVELEYFSQPLKFFKFFEAGMFGTYTWRGLYPNLLLSSVRVETYMIRLSDFKYMHEKMLNRRKKYLISIRRGEAIRERKRKPQVPAIISLY